MLLQLHTICQKGIKIANHHNKKLISQIFRYHAMDCLSLLETSSGNKSLHFANATQLFTFNQIYGLPFWSTAIKLQHSVFAKKEFENTMYLLTSTYHASKTQLQIFSQEGNLHLCKSAAEFLLEPWLLMQVPWNPAVYYQWLIAALAEVLRAKQQLVEFHTWLVGENLFSAVAKLLTQVETLHRRIILGFDLINWLSNSHVVSSGFDINCQAVECILNMVVLPSLPVIEFLLDDKFNIMVRALKRMAWPTEIQSTAAEEAGCKVYSFRVNKVEALLPVFRTELIESGETHMFGKIRSFQIIKKELADLPCEIAFAQVSTDKDWVS